MIKVSWSALKTIKANKNVPFQFRETDLSYDVFVSDSSIIFTTVINKSSPINTDQLDFEANFKAQANGVNSSSVLVTSLPNLLSFSPSSQTQEGLVVRSLPYEPATFVVSAESVVLGNNKSMISLVNTDATKIVKIQSVKLVNEQNATLTGVVVDFRFRRITGATGGTLLVPQEYDLSEFLPTQIEARTGATVSGESTGDLFKQKWSSDEWGVGTVDVEAQDHGLQSLLPIWQKIQDAAPITLRQNQGVTLKCVTNTTAGSFYIQIIFTVSNL